MDHELSKKSTNPPLNRRAGGISASPYALPQLRLAASLAVAPGEVAPRPLINVAKNQNVRSWWRCSWALLCHAWAVLGLSWAALGCWVLLGRSWLLLGYSWGALCSS